MADFASPAIEGIDVSPLWHDAEGGSPFVLVSLDDFFKRIGGTIRSRVLTPDEARALARKLTLTAEVAERGPRGNSRRFIK